MWVLGFRDESNGSLRELRTSNTRPATAMGVAEGRGRDPGGCGGGQLSRCVSGAAGLPRARSSRASTLVSVDPVAGVLV